VICTGLTTKYFFN